MPDTLREFKAQIFRALAHPTRIAIVDLLREEELSAGMIVEKLGLEQANASQHFAVLRSKHIVTTRKEGNQVFYSMRDSLLIDVLDIMRRYFQAHITEAMSMLNELEAEADEKTKTPSVRSKQARRHRQASPILPTR